MPPLSSPHALTRRALLIGIATTATTAILAACGDTPASTATPPATILTAPAAMGNMVAAPTVVPTAASVPTVAAAPTVTSMAGSVATTMPLPAPATPTAVARPAAQSTGELRFAVASFPNSVDALKDTNMLRFGVAETLMRLTPDFRLEPWLAEQITNVDPTTWRVMLRPNAKFHDGTPVTAADVVAAFARNFEVYPNANNLINRKTQITAVSPTTVEFKTPEPTGGFPNALTTSNFIIHKPRMAGGTDGTILTGPYRSTKFTVDTELTLEPFPDHWGGTPPIARISIKKVVDPNTQALALRTGETDFIYRVPTESVQGLGNEITISSIPSGLLDSITFNLKRPPFDDRAVREAVGWGVDRAALVQVALSGQGTQASGIFPPSLNIDTVPLQGNDTARAKQLLDSAGWRAGADGVRVKDGKRLAFTITAADPSQPELTACAIQMQAQLKLLGFDVQLMQAQSASQIIKDGAYDAIMRSSNSAQTGDPLFQLTRFYGGEGASNIGGYRNTQIDDLLIQLRGELVPAKRQAVSRQIQELGRADVPYVFLVVVPLVSAYRTAKVKNFVPHPDDTYLIDRTLSVT